MPNKSGLTSADHAMLAYELGHAKKLIKSIVVRLFARPGQHHRKAEIIRAHIDILRMELDQAFERELPGEYDPKVYL